MKKQEQEQEKKIDDIKNCKDSGKDIKKCIDEEKIKDSNNGNDLNSTELAKLDIINYEQQIFGNCMDDCTVRNENNCSGKCMEESGADSKSEAKLMLEMEKETGKENIKNCKENGSKLQSCLELEFQKNPAAKKQVIGSVKA